MLKKLTQKNVLFQLGLASSILCSKKNSNKLKIQVKIYVANIHLLLECSSYLYAYQPFIKYKKYT